SCEASSSVVSACAAGAQLERTTVSSAAHAPNGERRDAGLKPGSYLIKCTPSNALRLVGLDALVEVEGWIAGVGRRRGTRWCRTARRSCRRRGRGGGRRLRPHGRRLAYWSLPRRLFTLRRRGELGVGAGPRAQLDVQRRVTVHSYAALLGLEARALDPQRMFGAKGHVEPRRVARSLPAIQEHGGVFGGRANGEHGAARDAGGYARGRALCAVAARTQGTDGHAHHHGH